MNVLIIGKNSYIGSNVKEWLENKGHSVVEFDVEHEAVTEEIFNGIDSVVHVAAIVHRKDVKDYDLYKKINVDLPYSVACQAKKMGVKQMVFLSSMAVYEGGKTLKGKVVDQNTPCIPNTLYGRSKLEAEQVLKPLRDKTFKIAFIRPANVYGKGCRGAYMDKFKAIIKKLPVIPNAYQNVKQGMLYIDNLCELIRLIIDNKLDGVFPAQDKRPVSSVELMEQIALALGIKRKKSKFFGFPFKIFRIGLVKKLYGGIAYDDEYALLDAGDYQIVEFSEGIRQTFEF